MRGLILGLAVGLAVLFTAGDGRADYFDGQMLYDRCQKGDADGIDSLTSFGQCLGYVLGVYDSAPILDAAAEKRQWDGGWTACVPEGVEAGQLTAVVKKWLRAHPEKWHVHASGLVARAFQEAFPCR